jgi:hypothetical protein
MAGTGWDVDPKMTEDHRSDRLLSDFLGLKDSELCPVFGFDRNTYHLLALQVITSFLILKLCTLLSTFLPYLIQDRRQELLSPEPSPIEDDRCATPPREPDPLATLRSEQELGSALGSTLRPVSLEDQPFTSDMRLAMQTRSRPQTHLSTSMSDDEPRSMMQGEDREIQALNEEFQDRLARILEDRRQKEQEEMKRAADESLMAKQAEFELSQLEAAENISLPPVVMDSEQNMIIPIVPVVYWAWQVIMALVLLCAMLFSMTHYDGKWTQLMRSRGAWSHYNLFIFAYINSGMLPTAVQAFSYILTNMPVRPGSGTSYSSLHNDGGDDMRLLEIGSGGERAEQEELAEVNRRVFYLLLPLLMPFMAASVTHMVPFCFCYPWVVVLTAAITLGLVWVSRFVAAVVKASLKQESDAVMLVLQIVACLFAHSCVPVMTRVYGGEWRHGGYSNQLFTRVFRGEFEHVECTWFSFSHGVDAVLRWT